MTSTSHIVSSSRPLTRAAAALLISGAMLICTTFAHAGTPSVDALLTDAPRADVRYGDLDLTNEHDAQTLYRRISVAARKVCPDYGSLDLRRAAAGSHCVSDTIARAVREVNSPKLAEVEAFARRAKVG